VESATGDVNIGVNKGGISGFLRGYIAEIIVYDRTISATEQSKIEEYLAKKWGVEL